MIMMLSSFDVFAITTLVFVFVVSQVESRVAMLCDYTSLGIGTSCTGPTVFNQRFQIAYEVEFNETEKAMFCSNMVGYTDDFGGQGDDERVNVTCNVISQRLQVIEGLNEIKVFFNQLEYGMSYASNQTNVTTYSILFQNHVNKDLDRLTSDLQNVGLSVTNSFLAFSNIASIVPTIVQTLTSVATLARLIFE